MARAPSWLLPQLDGRGPGTPHAGQQREADDEEQTDGENAQALVAARGVGDGAEDEGPEDRRTLAAEGVEAEHLRLLAGGGQTGEQGAAGSLNGPETRAR